MTPTYESNAMDFEQSREYDGDSKLFVVFFRGTQLNEAKSQEAGRPIHDDVDMIKIVVPGQRDTVVAIADHSYQQRFPKQWAQFKANAEQTASGTPLSEVTWLTPAQIADLKAMNVHSVEQLASMPDANAHAFMGFHGLKQRAAAYIEAAAGAAPLLKMQAALDERDAQIAAMQAQLDKIMAAQTSAKASGTK